MENRQPPSKRWASPFHDELLLREVNNDSGTLRAFHSGKHMSLDINILQESNKRTPQLILVTIKPKTPSIKTIYIAEKRRFNSKKGSEVSGSLLAIGDHYSLNSYASNSSDVSSELYEVGLQSKLAQSEEIDIQSFDLPNLSKSENLNDINKNTVSAVEKCIIPSPVLTTMNVKTEFKKEINAPTPAKIDKATLIITNTSSEESLHSHTEKSVINHLNDRLDYLEKKVLQQELVYRTIDPMLTQSSDEESKNGERPTRSKRGKRTFIEQYSHVPETSAFHRYAQPAPLSPSKATTIDKEHNSEQYGRDFTTYDGITARGRRQCASVPLKRDEAPKHAAERVHKIRHKLNPVRDYRLMDTVHYLAQGEFAPRDDGIKLTPSREAVLSDIIWEDVCRTHWPNTRLSRRLQHSDRHNTRYELQRLIDNLLRERVAHVERRRRRHYRIVKLNHRHENCKPLGKTGDIIVASHKNRNVKDGRDIVGSDYGGEAMYDKHLHGYSRNHRSQERLIFQNDGKMRPRPRMKYDDALPGPSHAVPHSSSREPTCCYHTIHDQAQSERIDRNRSMQSNSKDATNVSCSRNSKNPRLVIKKEASRRHQSREQPNLEHYILLPTLVVRTPSNVRRQKKFNELYHRILNVQINQYGNHEEGENSRLTKSQNQQSYKKDISFNIHITSSESEDDHKNKI